MEEKISVIVPIYKVEKYLHKCVDSIINQTYKNLEIILVDDGSPDNCPAICDEYAKKDNRIKVIHKPNGGLSDARNAGLDIATGEYIAFVDSDDYIDLTMYEKLYNAIKQNDCDLAVCGYNAVDCDGNLIRQIKIKKTGMIDKEDVYDFYYSDNSPGFYVWLKLYKKDIFGKLRFPVGLNFEDIYIAPEICKYISKGITVLSEALYNYVVTRKDSITNIKTGKNRQDVIDVNEYVLDRLSNRKDQICFKYVVKGLLSTYIESYYCDVDRKVIIKKIKELYKNYHKVMFFKDKIKYYIFMYFRLYYNIKFK